LRNCMDSPGRKFFFSPLHRRALNRRINSAFFLSTTAHFVRNK
jgi:hypothetical protein